MTTPGGEGEGHTPSGLEAPVAAPRRGFDGVAVLAWIGAILFVVALPVLAIVAVMAIGSRNPEIADLWAAMTGRTPEHDEVLVAPLPGRPPEKSVEGDVRDRADLPESDGPVVVVNPSWLVQPAGKFPHLAERQGVTAGRVVLQCPVEVDGSIRSCWILSETPAGAGFGQAALNGAVRARLQPRTVDGVATRSMIRFTTAFRLD